MLVDESWVYKKYAEFAGLYFDGKMPSIQVKIGKTTGKWGYATCTSKYENGRVYSTDFTITISNAYDSPEHIKENTLLHEMIHIYDYYNFPEHFAVMVRGCLKSNRKYDAHGPEVFVPMAVKINEHGYKITKYVSDDEISVSNMTDSVMKRLSKPLCLCYAEYLTAGQENLMFLTTRELLTKTIARYNDPYFKKYAPMCITVYEISSPELRQQYSVNRNDEIRGYKYPMEKWFALLQHLGIENKTPEIIYFDNMEMNENQIIRLTESDIRGIIKETLNELMNSHEPIDGENAIAKEISPTSIRLSIA